MSVILSEAATPLSRSSRYLPLRSSRSRLIFHMEPVSLYTGPMKLPAAVGTTEGLWFNAWEFRPLATGANSKTLSAATTANSQPQSQPNLILLTKVVPKNPRRNTPMSNRRQRKPVPTTPKSTHNFKVINTLHEKSGGGAPCL